MAEPKIRPHPLVKELTKHGDTAVKVLGYFGSTSEGAVKVCRMLTFHRAIFSVVERPPDTRIKYSLNIGTVNAVSPCAGL